MRLHTKQEQGIRGLVSVRATIQDETTKILEYMRKMDLNNDLISEWFRQQKRSEEKEGDETP